MAYVVDPARMALVEDVVRLHAEFGALLDRIADAVDPDKREYDPCQGARSQLGMLLNYTIGLAVHGAAKRVDDMSVGEIVQHFGVHPMTAAD